MPIPLPPSAPIAPAIWVPWPWWSERLLLLLTKLYPWMLLQNHCYRHLCRWSLYLFRKHHDRSHLDFAINYFLNLGDQHLHQYQLHKPLHFDFQELYVFVQASVACVKFIRFCDMAGHLDREHLILVLIYRLVRRSRASFSIGRWIWRLAKSCWLKSAGISWEG